MNWETAKTWLIAAFLVLDMILGWQLVQTRQELQGYTESYSDLLANTKTLLAEHGMSLNTSVPTNQPELPTLTAKLAIVSLPDLAEAVFPKQNVAINASEGMAMAPSGELELLSPGTWRVNYTVPEAIDTTNVSAPLKYVWQGSDYAEDYASKDGHTVTFSQHFKTYPIFDAEVTVGIDQGSVKNFVQTYLQDISTLDDQKPVISALDALNSLANSVDNTGESGDNSILRMDLGYAEKATAGTDVQTTATTYWFPVWRVMTTNQIYYVNAFTGELEDLSTQSR